MSPARRCGNDNIRVAKAAQGAFRRMTIGVALADADDGVLRHDFTQEGIARRGFTAVMADFQHRRLQPLAICQSACSAFHSASPVKRNDVLPQSTRTTSDMSFVSVKPCPSERNVTCALPR